MLRAMKSYWAFTRGGYRIVVFLVMPLVSMLLTCAVMSCDPNFIVFPIIASFISLMIAEPMSDHWVLGGFYGKNKGALEFLQSSNRFAEFIKDVILVDFLRRICLYLGVYAGISIIGLLHGVGTGTSMLDKEAGLQTNIYVLFSFLPLLGIFMGQIEVVIGRHFDFSNHQYIATMVGFLLSWPIIMGCIGLDLEWILFVDVILIALIIAVGIGTVVYTNKKVRDSYYDA